MKCNMTFNCEYGNLRLEDCTTLPETDKLEEIFANLHDSGLGKLKNIKIENIRL